MKTKMLVTGLMVVGGIVGWLVWRKDRTYFIDPWAYNLEEE